MDKDYLIEKWLADKLTDHEMESFMKLDDHDLNLEILENAKYFKASHFSSVKSYDDFKKNLKSKNTPVINLSSYKVLFRIAALLVISISVYFAFFFNSITTVQTYASNKTTFELPDASSVVLNAHSTAKYSKNKWKNKREVSLDGEAFFKVAKGSKFDVMTSSGTVSVVGTQFNVNNRNNYFEVNCFEGIVSVNSDGKSTILTKGNTFRILNGVIAIDSTSNFQPEWILNKSSFKSVPLYVVIDEFERQYGVSIETRQIDTMRLITGGFVHNNLEVALKSITVPFDLSYKKDQSNKITLFRSE